jgi:hypothetical protein
MTHQKAALYEVTHKVIGQPPSPCGLWRAKEVSSLKGIVAGGNELRWNSTRRTHPGKGPNGARRMVRVNGRGYQRACSYRHHAAVAEMSVTSGFFRPGRADVALSVPALISRTAGSRSVCPVLREGRSVMGVPIPIYKFNCLLLLQK